MRMQSQSVDILAEKSFWEQEFLTYMTIKEIKKRIKLGDNFYKNKDIYTTCNL